MWQSHTCANTVNNVAQNQYQNKPNYRENHDVSKFSEIQNSLFTETSDRIRKKLTDCEFEFVDATNPMTTSGNFTVQTCDEENQNYNDIKTCDNKTPRNSMIRIEVTPDLPRNFPIECDPKSNVTNSILEKRKETYVQCQLVENNVNNIYHCTHCKKEYESKRDIIRHFKLKNCTEKLRENEDNENVVDTKIRGPRIVKLADNRYQCRYCNKTYTQKNNLFRHMRDDHVKMAKPISCNVCGKEFYNYRKLGQHMRCHSEKSYECSVCYKRFSQLAHLQSHMFTHTGEKPYGCHICERSFSKSFNLKIHIRRHKGEKEFKCRTCQTDFFTHGELEKHIRIHTAERPYSCNTCGKCFKQNGHLKKHILSHTGQKPYKCTICKKDYVNSSHLKRHILSHTGEKLPECLCPICNKNFSQPSTLKRHIAQVHRYYPHVQQMQ